MPDRWPNDLYYQQSAITRGYNTEIVKDRQTALDWMAPDQRPVTHASASHSACRPMVTRHGGRIFTSAAPGIISLYGSVQSTE